MIFKDVSTELDGFVLACFAPKVQLCVGSARAHSADGASKVVAQEKVIFVNFPTIAHQFFCLSVSRISLRKHNSALPWLDTM